MYSYAKNVDLRKQFTTCIHTKYTVGKFQPFTSVCLKHGVNSIGHRYIDLESTIIAMIERYIFRSYLPVLKNLKVSRENFYRLFYVFRLQIDSDKIILFLLCGMYGIILTSFVFRGFFSNLFIYKVTFIFSCVQAAHQNSQV